MPNAYILNQLPTGYGAAMSLLAEMLVAAGWNYRASGDGLSGYSATGKIFASTGSGALGWGNAKAYARLGDPAGGREFILQHDAAGGARIKYSALARFTGGTPSATVTPSATDERVIRGGGTDAAPTYGATWFNSGTTTGAAKYQGAAMETAPYGFWFAGAALAGTTPATGLLFDPVTSVPEDPDPVVIHCASTSAFRLGGYGGGDANSAGAWPAPGAAAQSCWAHMDVARSKFLSVQPAYNGVGGDRGGLSGANCSWGTANNGLAVNPFNGLYEAVPILYTRTYLTTILASPWGIKGWSTLARWTTVSRSNFNDTMNSLQWIAVGYLWLPWDGVTVPTSS